MKFRKLKPSELEEELTSVKTYGEPPSLYFYAPPCNAFETIASSDINFRIAASSDINFRIEPRLINVGRDNDD